MYLHDSRSQLCCCLVETQVTATKIDRELRRVVWTKWKSHAVENSIKISPPTHPNPVEFLQKSFQHAPQILPKWSRKPPEHEERQVAATKARRLPKFIRFGHAIRWLLGSNWVPNLMKIRTKTNVEKNMVYRLVFHDLGLILEVFFQDILSEKQFQFRKRKKLKNLTKHWPCQQKWRVCKKKTDLKSIENH